MSVARPLSGPEVKKCVLASLSQAAQEAGLTPDSFADSVGRWLDAQSLLSRDHLVYPKVQWEIEVTLETPRKEFGSHQTLHPYITAQLDIDLGNGQILVQRFGTSAPLDRDCDTVIGKSWQETTTIPDRIRNRWLVGVPLEPLPSANAPLAEAEVEAVKQPRVFVTIQDLPDADLLGQPSVPETIEEPEPEAEPPRRRNPKK